LEEAQAKVDAERGVLESLWTYFMIQNDWLRADLKGIDRSQLAPYRRDICPTKGRRSVTGGVAIVRTFAAVQVALLSSFSFISSVFAQSATPLRPPSRPTDPSCIHHVPNGAHIDAQTWDVSLNNATIAQYPPCTSAGSVAIPDTSSGGYYVQFVTPNESTTVSDNFGGNFTVPPYPSVEDYGPEYWSNWPGLVAYSWPPSISGSNAVLQPTLDWYASEPYVLTADLDFGPAGSYTQYNSGDIYAYPGDEAQSYILSVCE
jgi:hypothetical protein